MGLIEVENEARILAQSLLRDVESYKGSAELTERKLKVAVQDARELYRSRVSTELHDVFDKELAQTAFADVLSRLASSPYAAAKPAEPAKTEPEPAAPPEPEAPPAESITPEPAPAAAAKRAPSAPPARAPSEPPKPAKPLPKPPARPKPEWAKSATETPKPAVARASSRPPSVTPRAPSKPPSVTPKSPSVTPKAPSVAPKPATATPRPMTKPAFQPPRAQPSSGVKLMGIAARPKVPPVVKPSEPATAETKAEALEAKAAEAKPAEASAPEAISAEVKPPALEVPKVEPPPLEAPKPAPTPALPSMSLGSPLREISETPDFGGAAKWQRTVTVDLRVVIAVGALFLIAFIWALAT